MGFPKFKEFFYLANIIDYGRLYLLWLAMQYTDYRFAVFYSLSYLLDAVDGEVARYMHQTSDLGYYLDMISDRLASCVCLHFGAKALLSGQTLVPPTLVPFGVFLMYFSLVMVEVVAHGVVCYIASKGNCHQKTMGFEYTLIRLYLGNRKILLFSCAAFEGFTLSLILASSKTPPGTEFWSVAALISFPGFLFRAAANLNRLWAIYFSKDDDGNSKEHDGNSEKQQRKNKKTNKDGNKENHGQGTKTEQKKKIANKENNKTEQGRHKEENDNAQSPKQGGRRKTKKNRD